MFNKNKMIKHNEFLIDLLNVLPSSIDCYLQAPSLENKVI